MSFLVVLNYLTLYVVDLFCIAAVGMVNGCVHILDALTLEDEMEPFRYSKDAITHLAFSHDSQFLATGVSHGHFFPL